ncbi:DUF3108 domain-containing protein [Ferrimonas gelatinilytica]|uniref:DUF3108 domain-containing protein n=1 Tax=Ferrimonas gelatinilytica TaxID=1255257 RepID=A0ABP9RY85_9GAMM
MFLHRRAAPLAAMMLTLLFCAPSALAELATFTAEYRAYASGLPCGRGRWSLHPMDGVDEIPRYQYRAEGKLCIMGQRVDHRSNFLLMERGPVPENYRSQFKGVFRSRTLEGEFDGQHFQVTLDGQPLENEDSFPPARWEPGLLLYHLGLARESLTLSYTWGEETREYLFEYHGSEEIETPLGPVLAHKLVQDHPGKERVAQFWFAPALNNALVQMKVSRLGLPWLTVKMTDYRSDATSLPAPSAD